MTFGVSSFQVYYLEQILNFSVDHFPLAGSRTDTITTLMKVVRDMLRRPLPRKNVEPLGWLRIRVQSLPCLLSAHQSHYVYKACSVKMTQTPGYGGRWSVCCPDTHSFPIFSTRYKVQDPYYIQCSKGTRLSEESPNHSGLVGTRFLHLYRR